MYNYDDRVCDDVDDYDEEDLTVQMMLMVLMRNDSYDVG